MGSPVLRHEALRDQAGSSPGDLWTAVDGLLDRGSTDGILFHGLGSLGAKRLRRLGRDVPSSLQREERSAALFRGIATPLLERIRQSCEGPLILIKGPELVRLYPSGGRSFSDIDLLAPEPDAVQESLLQTGFSLEEQGLTAPHHLQPLFLESLPLEVEIHGGVKWPEKLRPPDFAEILEASIPSSLQVEGLLAPSSAHHALILAAHSWEHRPMRVVRDLLDIALVAAEADEREIRKAAAAWGLGRIWETNWGAIAGLFYDGRRTAPLRSWARHIEAVRERTVLEQHLERWMSPFWALPTRRAFANTVKILRDELAPEAGESWRDKLSRTATALRDAQLPLSKHDDRAPRPSPRSGPHAESPSRAASDDSNPVA